MALTPSHGAIGALPSVALTIGFFGINPITILLASLWGAYAAHKSMLADLYGILGGTPKTYTIYVRAHKGDIAVKNEKNLYYWFHLVWDKLFHRTTAPFRWKPLGYVIEPIQDGLLGWAYFLLVGWIATLCIFAGFCLYVAFVKVFRDTIKTAWLSPYL